MAAYKAALINEIEKLYKKKKALVALIISLVVIVLGQLAVVGVRTGFGVRGTGSVEFSVLVLSVVVNTILPLFTALVAIDCFSGEFSHNLMRVTLTRPVSRLKIYTAKVTAIAVFILANLMILMVFSMLAGFLFNANSATITAVARTVLVYVISLFPLFTLSLGIVFLANILKSGTSIFFVAIIVFLAIKAFGIFFSEYASLLITTQLDWYNLWLANSLPLAKIGREFCLMLGYALMFFAVGFYLFDKKEF
ncbi:MAG: ABC transporter permease [Dehalobacter sp. 4CP]|uniref:ABC transporter permease n=1 Tax=Dehalobacter sp. CP TaxID=2594474 RepID=UPI0013C55C5E|nr:ABC transporter permease [Dehalobacter sp. 4CP]